jgi:threonine dehydratase
LALERGVKAVEELHRDVLEGVGNTPLLMLRNVVPENRARILLKLESLNPTGSRKDRMALAMVEATIVTVMCDSGMKCLSSALYRTREDSGS